ncbi:Haloacid dehalogenase-like hydrolase [Xylaria acuta]|nr:Haloacid dehalogenase-like hydrolase [Xylaria acuta]
MQEPPTEDLQICLFIACPRSGSALLMRIFAELPECAVTSRLTLRRAPAVGMKFTPDPSILQHLAIHKVVQCARNDGKRILICKEGFGNKMDEECAHELLPRISGYATFRPVFLIRDPVRVFDSWKKMGWTDIQSFMHCFSNLFRMLEQADPSLISCLLYEQLARESRREVERVCAFWGIPFLDTMLEFSAPFSASFLYERADEKDTYCCQHQSELFSTVNDNVTVVENMPCQGLVTNDEKTMIEDRAMRERYRIPFPSLKSRYSEVVRTSTSNAFADGRSSSEYRRGRFLLRTIKRLGKKIVVITEGPQDAQEWTVENLGISPYIDFLATTNHFKISKTDRLFTKVSEKLGITSSEIAYVGDNEHRDMKPAIAEGILSFHLDESLNCNLEVYPPRINTLNKLEHILLSSGEKGGSEKSELTV